MHLFKDVSSNGTATWCEREETGVIAEDPMQCDCIPCLERAEEFGAQAAKRRAALVMEISLK